MNIFIGMGRLVNDPKVAVKENADSSENKSSEISENIEKLPFEQEDE